MRVGLDAEVMQECVLTICRTGLFLARVCMPSQWPKFFKMALSEKLLLVLSACRMTCNCAHQYKCYYNVDMMDPYWGKGWDPYWGKGCDPDLDVSVGLPENLFVELYRIKKVHEIHVQSMEVGFY